jgi:hypothetical protein
VKAIKEQLSLRAAPEGGCADVREHAETKIEDIDENVHLLTAVKSAFNACR